MAVTTGNDYDHIDIAHGDNATRHFLKDSKAREDLVVQQAAQPSSDVNKIWFPSTIVDEVAVPTEAEHEALAQEVNSLKSASDLLADRSYYTNAGLYTAYEQGTINSSGGATDNDNWVRTGYIPIEQIYTFYRQTGIQTTIYYYDGDKTYADKYTQSSQNNPSATISATNMLSVCPTAKYIRIRMRMYDGSTALTTTPAMILASGLKINTVEPTSNIASAVTPDGYMSLSNVTLTENTTYTIPYNYNSVKNMVFTIRSKYTGSTQPTLKFSRGWLGSDNQMHNYYVSAEFPLGGADYKDQQIRVPASVPTSGATNVIITVPSGSTLYIAALNNAYSNDRVIGDFGINLNGHGRYGCGGPQNTAAGYNAAARMGYKYCVTIPKVTSDGVLVCLHDDDSIQSTARNDDGSQIAAEYQDHPVSYFTYEQLMAFDFGISRGLPYKGERIPTLERFFEICAKTGMHPMLSCHPSLSGYWATIKALAVKYNLLDKLNIKCDYSNITVMMDALGGDIESYTIDESGGTDRAARMTELIERYSIDTTKCRCGVEYISTITDALIESALEAGLFVGYANYGTDAASVKALIAKGVTEFTDDCIASVGLDW